MLKFLKAGHKKVKQRVGDQSPEEVHEMLLSKAIGEMIGYKTWRTKKT